MQIKKIADSAAACLLMASFFLPMRLQVVVLAIAVLYFVVASIRQREPISGKAVSVAMLVGAVYLLYLLAIPLTPPAFRSEIPALAERRLSLLLIPLLLAICSSQQLKIMLNHILVFAYGALIVSVTVDAWYLIGEVWLHHRTFDHVSYRDFFEDMCGLHPTYISMYLAFSLVIQVFCNRLNNRLFRWVLASATLFCLLLLLAKAVVIALLLIAAHQGWQQRKQLWSYKLPIFISILLLALVCYFVPVINQRIAEVANVMRGSKGTVVSNSMTARSMILSTDLNVLAKYWLQGTGPARLQSVLRAHYTLHSLRLGLKAGSYDPHNEYLYEWLSFGVIGIVVLLTCLFTHYRTAISAKNYPYLYLLFILSITFFTESVLGKQQGVVFFAVFTSLYLFNYVKKSSSTNKLNFRNHN
jgi:O-antigen ligase